MVVFIFVTFFLYTSVNLSFFVVVRGMCEIFSLKNENPVNEHKNKVNLSIIYIMYKKNANNQNVAKQRKDNLNCKVTTLLKGQSYKSRDLHLNKNEK